MKWSELIKIAEAYGYEFKSHGRRHDRYHNKEKRDTIMVERHGSQEVRKGLLEKLLKQIKS